MPGGTAVNWQGPTFLPAGVEYYCTYAEKLESESQIQSTEHKLVPLTTPPSTYANYFIAMSSPLTVLFIYSVLVLKIYCIKNSPSENKQLQNFQEI